RGHRFVEGGDPPFVPRGRIAQRDACEILVAQVAHGDGQAGEASQPLVVEDDELAALAKAHVALDAVRALPLGLLEGGERVLQRVAARTAMRPDERTLLPPKRASVVPC